MDPCGVEELPDLGNLRIDLLRQAVEIYLGEAYPSGQIPEAVKKRLVWPDDAAPSALLTAPPFERASRPGKNPPVFALRLGNVRYPHMKLQIQPWPSDSGFLLSVNTHDQALSLDPNAPDAAAFRALQAENQRFKEAIEHAWDAQGLPTFLRYLRDYINTHSTSDGQRLHGEAAD